MKSKQFNDIADLLRLSEPAKAAARSVLIDGKANKEAAAIFNVSLQSVANAVKRVKSAHEKETALYLMKPEQFDVLADLLRSHGPIRAAARAVIIDNMTTTEAATAHQLSPQSVSNALKRFGSAHDKVSAVYAPAGV